MVTDYAMAMLLKKRMHPLFNIFLFRSCYDLFVPNFRNVRLKSVFFSDLRHFFTFVSLFLSLGHEIDMVLPPGGILQTMFFL